MVMAAQLKCPDCGTPLTDKPWAAGLCLPCLADLARDDTSLEAELRVEPGEAPTLQFSPDRTFSEGEIHGERYRIRSLLGRGGMGEVWRAYDLKLRQDVALKALRTELIQDRQALETLRQEVRTAREVISPNVCRVFDLQELDDQELVSMEYIDGTTLQEILIERSPLDLDEAREIASQFLAGLEAIHDADLVHRDIKPENVMMTRTGRVVVMDFGIAKGLQEGRGGVVAGTPAYMSPEQSRGSELDSRSDIYSAGVVLAEMVAPGGIRSLENRKRVWEGIHQETSALSESPWSAVIAKSVASEREQRFPSASSLARALEEVTLRAIGDETARPYPGLSAFQEEDSRFFFGRELEVEALWKKLRRPHLIAVMGPSGAGKSSFLRAGLLPTLTDDWRAVVATPGNRPFSNLARQLAPGLGDDPENVDRLLRFEDLDVAVEVVSEWREQGKHGLIIVDQFEELFTQSPLEVQGSFAELLGRLPLEADAHVLLSMRDDFLFHCQSFESLAPVFSEMTPLGPPTGTSLRRAMVEPALRCGYRFEEESIVEEMLAEVEGERGALPMVAFAAAQLWEKRDRDTGLLTREAYDQVGGVGGALAQHAEVILEEIGEEHVSIVRELFRNLVTAQGTRAAREREELLSVFGDGRLSDRVAAATILNTLIDARLLTTYEGTAHQRVEIIHESLLTAWPRLVRWQMQDAEGAKLRDELRHQAHVWQEKDRPEDLLWTGTAYREFELWRERYPGGLTELEEAFGTAMTHHAERRKRRRRIAVAATFVVLVVVLAIIGGFWRRSVAETLRAEAANLFSLGQLRLEDHPTAAIAYSIASLELADNPEVRRLAVEALWRGPTEIRLPTASYFSVDFSPDGRWLATADPTDGGSGKLWPSDGGPPTVLEGNVMAMYVRISPRGDLIAVNIEGEEGEGELGFWSVPEGRFLRSIVLGGSTRFLRFSRDGERLITSTEIGEGERFELEVRSWPVEGGEPDILARLELPPDSSLLTHSGVDPPDSRLSWAEGRSVRIARLAGTSIDMASVTSVKHDRTIADQTYDEQGLQLATSDTGGTIRIWLLESDPPELTHTFSGEGGVSATVILFDPSGTVLASKRLFWDLTASPEAEPLRLRRPGRFAGALAFDPTGRWLATSHPDASVSLWPLARTYPQVLRGHEESITGVAFTPDGERLVSTSEDGSVRSWPLNGGSSERSRILYQDDGVFLYPRLLRMAPDGSFVAIARGEGTGRVVVLPLDDRPARELPGFSDHITAVAVGPQSRLVAAGAGLGLFSEEEAIVRVWDLESEEVRILDAGDGEQIKILEFADEGDLWVASGRKIRRWNLAGGEPRILEEIDLSSPEFVSDELTELDPNGRQVLLWGEFSRLWIQDLDTYDSRELSSHGSINWCDLDATGKILISTTTLGAIQVGPVTGEEPHLLLGHEGRATPRAVSPDGKWIASIGWDLTIRLWPMPDFSRPPIHALPRDELLAKLRSLTNLRVVEDPDSLSGWKVEVGPFLGWETVPTW